MGALALSDLRAISGEPRVHDLRLGEVLGFDRPRNVRKIIRRNMGELQLHGGVCSTAEQTPSRRGRVGEGRPGDDFHLNEAQALLVCMFARTNEAIAARKQIVEVFLAWRHGRLTPVGRKESAEDRDLPWAKMEQRLKRLERLLDMQARIETEAFASAIAYAPPILYLNGRDGKRRHQRRPGWWYDREVREAVIACHRQMTIDIAVASIVATLGEHRAPSRSSLARFWLTLDQVRAAS